MTDDDWVGPVLRNTFDLWFAPELDRRARERRIPHGFVVWGVQAIVDLELPNLIVNINDELKGIFRTRPKQPMEKGQILSFSEIGDIEGMELTDEYPNAGHFTAILHNGNWFVAFDFRRNATRIAEHLSAITEFMATAGDAIGRGHSRAAIENLFAAVELMAKFFLLMVPDARVLTATSHGFIHSTFNLYSSTGVAPSEYASLLNRLSSLRPVVRYLRGPAPAIEECADLLRRARAMFSHLDESRPRRRSEE